MKLKLILLLLLLSLTSSQAQTVIFSENMGSPTGTKTIATNTFQNSASLSYSNGAQSNAADIRITSSSGGNTNDGNVFFSSTSGAYGFSIEGINTNSYTALTLEYKYKKEAAAAHATFSVDYWNGASWITLANTATDLFNENNGASAVWYVAKALALPSSAQFNGLKIRFVKTGNTAIRIDDVKLTGTQLPPPTITPSGTLSALNTVYGSASSALSFSVSGTNLTDNLVITPPSGFEVSQSTGGTTGYASSQTLTPSSGSVPSITLYIRLSATAGSGNYAGDITFSSANDGLSTSLATVPSSVSKLDAYITGITASNKAYDGTTVATLNGTAILNGILPFDTSNVVVNATAATATFTDAAIGVGKAITVSGYLLSGSASTNYNLIQPSGLTANITANASSDIIFNSGSTTSDNININYKNWQATPIEAVNGSKGSVGVMGFYLRDGGATDDADNLNTELTAITFNVTNATNIRSARLFVGTSPRGTSVNVNGASVIEFTGLTNIVALDNDRLAVNLRVTFNTTVTDNQQMQFTIASATASGTGSQFTATNGGGASSSIAGDINRIEVTADRVAFVQQPPSSSFIQSNMDPAPSIGAIDSNSNRDLDFSSEVVITSSGTLTSPQTVTATNGLAIFNAINHSIAGTGIVLTASASGLESINSSALTIHPLIVPTFEAVSSICSGATLSALPTTSTNNISGSWSPELNNTQTTTYTFIPTSGQNATNATLSIEVIQPTAPTFEQVGIIGNGAITYQLPSTSSNGITGTWNPTTLLEGEHDYTFTPSTGQCSTTITMPFMVLKPKMIVAYDDDFSDSPINVNEGGQTATVLANDGINFGEAATEDNITVSIVAINPPLDLTTYDPIVINPDGTITIPIGTPVGTYTISYQITSTACPLNQDSATATIVVRNPSAARKAKPVEKLSNKILIYPNPSTAIFNFDLTAVKAEYNAVKIYNVLGQILYQGSLTPKTSNPIDLSNAPSGHYIAKVSGNSENVSFQLIKQ